MNLAYRKNISFAILRITFGIIWLIDAFFKWQPGFINQFTGYITETLDGQPKMIQDWINLWVRLVDGNPHFFAYAVAVTETLIGLGLVFGLFTKLVCWGGMIFVLIIWSTAQGFGGPYASGSTDIGSAIIYALVFIALLLGESDNALSLDKKIKLV